MKKLYLLGCALMITAIVNAGTKTWVGGASGDWYWASNWSPAGLPSPADDIVIDGATVNVYNSANVKTITLKNSAELIVWKGASGDVSLSIPFESAFPAITLNAGTTLRV